MYLNSEGNNHILQFVQPATPSPPIGYQSRSQHCLNMALISCVWYHYCMCVKLSARSTQLLLLCWAFSWSDHCWSFLVAEGRKNIVFMPPLFSPFVSCVNAKAHRGNVVTFGTTLTQNQNIQTLVVKGRGHCDLMSVHSQKRLKEIWTHALTD